MHRTSGDLYVLLFLVSRPVCKLSREPWWGPCGPSPLVGVSYKHTHLHYSQFRTCSHTSIIKRIVGFRVQALHTFRALELYCHRATAAEL